MPWQCHTSCASRHLEGHRSCMSHHISLHRANLHHSICLQYLSLSDPQTSDEQRACSRDSWPSAAWPEEASAPRRGTAPSSMPVVMPIPDSAFSPPAGALTSTASLPQVRMYTAPHGQGSLPIVWLMGCCEQSPSAWSAATVQQGWSR